MQKKLSLPNTTLLTVGAMIGSAIFSLSGVTILQSGSSSLFTWLIAGIILLVYGLLAAYLANKYPKTGGMYLFPTAVLSSIINKNKKTKTNLLLKIVGTLTTTAYLGGCIAGVIFSLQYISIYLVMLFPDLSNYSIIIAIFALFLVCALNLLKIQNTGRVNGVLTCILLVILITYSFICLISGSFNFTKIMDNFGTVNETFSGVQTAMLAYGSIVVPAFLVTNIKNPKKNIPLSQIFAMIITVFVYLFAIFATVGIINKQDFIHSPGTAYTPFDFALQTANMPYFAMITTIGAILALFTTALVVMKLSIISFEQFSENGIFSKKLNTFLKKEHINTLVITVIILICLNLGSAVEEIINIGGTFNMIFIIIICITAIVCFIKSKPLKHSQSAKSAK